jgi:hypothetical protein
MAIADFWFHHDEAVAGSQDKKKVLAKVKKSKLRDYLGPTSAPAALPSAHEIRLKVMAPKKEEKKPTKKSTKDKILYKA